MTPEQAYQAGAEAMRQAIIDWMIENNSAIYSRDLSAFTIPPMPESMKEDVLYTEADEKEYQALRERKQNPNRIFTQEERYRIDELAVKRFYGHKDSVMRRKDGENGV